MINDMPRSNRPRRQSKPRGNSRGSSGGGSRYEADSEADFGSARREDDWMQRARYGVVMLQDAPDGQWHVRKISPLNAQKTYTCPGCHRQITVGVAHLVAWRADHWSGDDAAATARRHWHPRCWETRSYKY